MTNHIQEAIWDQDLILKYNVTGPRYTSYPTAVQFEDCSAEDFMAHITESARQSKATAPLSLYVHVPFCQHVCFYCGCNKIATKDQSRADQYLNALEEEMKTLAPYFRGRPVQQLHWGGGTPTFLSGEQTKRLIKMLRQNFDILADDLGEYSIEIDPRVTTPDRLMLLRELGFNRISLGVQDFNEPTQIAINRTQSYELVEESVTAAKEYGFFSISFDLIYGLPHQTQESFDQTLDRVIELNPDRIAVYNYAHLPERFMPQRRINESDLPSPSEKLDILGHAISKLQKAGYVYIGMDHFAKPDDDLVKAQEEGTLQRNFQGYSTNGDTDLLGLGVSSISHISNAFLQNFRELDKYEEAALNGVPSTFKGYSLNNDDIVRQQVIKDLSCNGWVDYEKLDEQFDIDSRAYFSHELVRLASLEEDGLVKLEENGIKVTMQGRLLLRPICMVFDAYLQRDAHKASFSKVV